MLRSQKPWHLLDVLGTVGEPLERRGTLAWSHDLWTQNEGGVEFQVIYGPRYHMN